MVIASACDPSVHPSEAQSEAFFESREWVIDGATVAELKDVRSNVIQEYGYGRYKKLVTQRTEENGVNANREKLIRFAVQHMASSDVGSSS
ncbi:MAG: hypothetical protein PUK40_08050 [Actinomycetaceae bacterium]|nr:hypothetical protein [Arcanobacterium sp.]MDD7505870.1 hypothetical protein [Actinomycetaceae bacterium]MDY6143682.1 hypothetical protein [Arcanobacterium sp.]